MSLSASWARKPEMQKLREYLRTRKRPTGNLDYQEGYKDALEEVLVYLGGQRKKQEFKTLVSIALVDRNLVGVEFDIPFSKIIFPHIRDKVVSLLGRKHVDDIKGWANTSNLTKHKSKSV